MTVVADAPRPIAGYFGFLLGAVALILVLVQFSAGPFAPQQEVSVSVGEIAAEIRQSALNALKGEDPPAPKVAPWDIDRVLKLVASVLAGVAVLLGIFAFIRSEPRKPAAAAIAVGVGAGLVQLFVWAILMVVGALILIAIIGSVGGILGG